jgi:hypothetical protein
MFTWFDRAKEEILHNWDFLWYCSGCKVMHPGEILENGQVIMLCPEGRDEDAG